MADETQLRLEDLRREIIAALYARRAGAHEAGTIRSLFLRGQYTQGEVETALTDLERFGYVESIFESELTSIPLYQISAAGITFKERGFRS